MESNGTHYFVLSQTFESGVDSGCCGMLPWPPSPHLRTEGFIPPTAGSVDKWQRLSTISPSKALLCFHPGPSPLPEHSPEPGASWCNRRRPLFSQFRTVLRQTFLRAGLSTLLYCFNFSLCPPSLPAPFHRDLCWELPTVNFMHTSLHLKVFPRSHQQQCLNPIVSMSWKDSKFESSQAKRETPTNDLALHWNVNN